MHPFKYPEIWEQSHFPDSLYCKSAAYIQPSPFPEQCLTVRRHRGLCNAYGNLPADVPAKIHLLSVYAEFSLSEAGALLSDRQSCHENRLLHRHIKRQAGHCTHGKTDHTVSSVFLGLLFHLRLCVPAQERAAA